MCIVCVRFSNLIIATKSSLLVRDFKFLSAIAIMEFKTLSLNQIRNVVFTFEICSNGSTDRHLSNEQFFNSLVAIELPRLNWGHPVIY